MRRSASRNGPDAAAALLVADQQQPDRLAFDLDAHRHGVARAGQDVLSAVAAVGEQPFELVLARRNGRARVAADGAAQPERVVLEQVERAAPRVGERHRAQQDALGQLLQIQGGGDREPDLVDRLELDLAVALLEPLDAQAVAQLADLLGLGEQELVRPRRR